jgi:hypothetical protein
MCKNNVQMMSFSRGVRFILQRSFPQVIFNTPRIKWC